VGWSNFASYVRGATVRYFDGKTLTLKFNGQKWASVKPHFRSKRVLLWPARSFRVVAPRVGLRPANFLQRAVLGLCRAGISLVDEITDLLDIDEDLAKLLLGQLANVGYLNKNAEPTERGQEVLEGLLRIDEDELVAGHVFVDPWTNELWPRFEEKLAAVDLVWEEGRWPQLIGGTTGQPHKTSCFAVIPREVPRPRQPDARDILEAVHKHRRGLRVGSFSGDEQSNVRDIDRIQFVEDRPEPVWLTTFVYRPEEVLDHGGDWRVSDPFGKGDSVRLRRNVEVRRREDEYLDKQITKLIGQTDETADELHRESMEKLRARAGDRISSQLGAGVKQTPLFSRLLSTVRSYLECQGLEGKSFADKRENVLKNCQQALEHLFILLRDEFPRPRAWEQLKGTDSYKAELMSGLAEACGFELPLPERLERPRRSDVEAASQYNTRSLRAYVAAVLLTTNVHPGHPLRKHGCESPDLLARIDRIAASRNPATHHNDRQFGLDELAEAVETVLQAVELFWMKPNLTETTR
jgi:hypothetical protein